MSKKKPRDKKKVEKTRFKSPFTKEELRKIRKILRLEKEKIIEDLVKIKGESTRKSPKDASGDLSGYSFHMADMASDLYDREFSLELAEGERERLFSLDDAIKRIDEGKYGRCDNCGAAISKQRLKIMPQAGYCIKCQEKEETSTSR